MIDQGLMKKAVKAARPAGFPLGLLVFSLSALAVLAQTNLELLTTARQVHQLTADQAKLSRPVLLRATVTFYSKANEELFVHDDTGGIYIIINHNCKIPLESGQWLEIEGVSDPGGFAPDVRAKKISLLGRKPLPPPKPVTFEQMASGQEDCNWVEFSGIVRSITTGRIDYFADLEVAGSGGKSAALIMNYDLQRCEALIDAEVTVRGVCVAHFNNQRQLLEVGAQVTGMDDITVKTPAPSQPFESKTRPINNLGQYAPLENIGHRVKVRGTVTLQQLGRSLFIKDETQGLYLQTTQPTIVQPGDQIEALGFPASAENYTPSLQNAIFRKVGTGPPPEPVKIFEKDIGRGTYDSYLVQVEARLLNQVKRQEDQVLELESSNLIFTAQLANSAPDRAALALIPNNSRVLLTGVCLVQKNWGFGSPHAFTILLRSAADVAVIARPSWWTASHTLWVFGVTLAVFLASLAWVAVLRNRVKVQTKIIRQKIQREVALEERTRIAQDIHDDLGAELTHVVFLSEESQGDEELPRARENFRNIFNALQGIMRSLDEIVWVVNPKNDTLDRLANYICNFAEDFFRGGKISVRLDLPDRLPDSLIPPEIRNNLFLAAKEALNNISKHAGASEVVIRIRLASSILTIAIEDNGHGFDPAEKADAGNGLPNMKQRLEKIGGQFALESRPAAGTRILLTLALPGDAKTIPLPV